MNSFIKSWSGEMLTIHFDQPTGAWIIIAIHSIRAGTSGGGTRMHRYPSVDLAVQDAMKLAEGMTYKFAVANIMQGGAKAVIALPESFGQEERAGLLRRYGKLVHTLQGLFYTGPDVGTNALDMNTIAEAGSPYIFGRTPEAGGVGDTGPLTAAGLYAGIQVTCEELFGSPLLEGRRILVQGAGSVGGALIERLHEVGAEVLFSDINDGTIQKYQEEYGATYVPSGMVYDTRCDIFAPCSLGGGLNSTTIPRLQCLAVAGGANNQLAKPEDGQHLRARGILYAPDYVLNVGAGIGMLGIELDGWTEAEAEEEVISTVSTSLRHVFKLAKQQGITTAAAARQLAHERLSTNDESSEIPSHSSDVGSTAATVELLQNPLPALQFA